MVGKKTVSEILKLLEFLFSPGILRMLDILGCVQVVLVLFEGVGSIKLLLVLVKDRMIELVVELVGELDPRAFLGENLDVLPHQVGGLKLLMLQVDRLLRRVMRRVSGLGRLHIHLQIELIEHVVLVENLGGGL